MRTGRIGRLGVLVALMALVSSAAHADRIGYNKIVSISAETVDLRADHSHDWSPATHEARWKMISATKDPFSAENTYSYLQLREKGKGTILFRRPVPALSYIWISSNSKYVVGLSNIKLWNPYQIAVFNRSGDCLFKRDLTGIRLNGARESASNWINWYKEPAPKIEIIERGAMATLLIEDPLGGFNRFEFAAGN